LSFDGPGSFTVDVQAETAVSRAGAPTESIRPLRLGHVAFKMSSVDKATRFFTEILDFRVSDWMGDFFVFLRCGPEPPHGQFPQQSETAHAHIAFQLKDVSHIRDACDFLGRKRIALIWGPGRHGPGHNIFTYHRDPDGQIIELYAEIDQMSDEALGYFDPRPWHEDSPQRPKVWEPGLSTSNIWGIPGPQSFRE